VKVERRRIKRAHHRFQRSEIEPCRLGERTRLSDAAGLTQYGVNLLRLSPGTWSSQRHWHAMEDEFIYVLSGELVLTTEAGEEVLRGGDCVGFKGGDPDGHCPPEPRHHGRNGFGNWLAHPGRTRDVF
jgi:uncharacterized cupin superfamily protein